MRAICWWCVVLLAGAAVPARAQVPTGPDKDPSRAAALRQQIEDRFAERVKEQLGLSDEQAAQLRVTANTYGDRRRELQRRERDLRQALAGQLRPGVAANQDSVSRLTDGLVNIKSAYAQTFRDENRDMARYLTPVQRSRLFVMRERLQRRVQQIRERRREEQGLPPARGRGRRPGPRFRYQNR
ncbi:MAG TPA: Spy/CpxP family protein refolding chaperone [Gemmatimonadales bacterium]|nr:Spy/CpxP family protein refolding chaperone [Gemmatimonadales bacterium]